MQAQSNSAAAAVKTGAAQVSEIAGAKIDSIDVSTYVIPTDYPESDGTIEWNKTTLVLVEARSGEVRGLGYSYADLSTAKLIRDLLADVVRGRDAMDVAAAWNAMVHSI